MPKPNPVHAALAARLVKARQAAGFETAHAAAIRLAMHPQTYIVHEQGCVAVKPAELRRYAKAFGVSHGWLSTGIGAGPREAVCMCICAWQVRGKGRT